MPHFAIYCTDKPDSAELRAATRPAHLDHVGALGDSIVVVGPILDHEGRACGSIIIAAFHDEAAAHAFAHNDPYARAGLFADVRIHQWRQVLPAQ